MKTLPRILSLLGFLGLGQCAHAATVATGDALEIRHRNPTASNYATNMYAHIPPSGQAGLILFTGADDIETVVLGPGLSWTPRDPSGTPHGQLNVAPQIQPDWNAVSGLGQILNKPSLFSGAWADLTGKPTFSTVATSGAYSDLSGLPTLFDGTWGSLTGKPTFAAVAVSGAYSDLSGVPSLGTAAAQNTSFFATAAQGTLASTAVQPGSLSTVATTGVYADLLSKPTLGTAAAQNSTTFATAAQGVLASTAVQPGSLATVAVTGAYSDLSGKPTLGTAAATAITDYATAAQGTLAGTALQPAAIGVSVQAYSAALGTFSTNGSSYYLSRANHTGTQSVSTITGLAGVATTGAYSSLSGLPTLGTAAAQNTTAFDAAGAATTAQAFAIQRANHTGSQAISTVTGLQAALDSKTTVYRVIGTVAGGAGRVTVTYPSFGAGVVPVVQAVAVKPTGATLSYNTAIYGDPTDTSCTVETNTVNPTILGILGSILVTQPAPNGTKVHIYVTAP